MSRARRVDLNQTDVVITFRLAGARVRVCSDIGSGHPDLIVVWDTPDGWRTAYVEVKSRTGKLTKAQRQWQEETRNEIHIVRTPEEALQLLGQKYEVIDMPARRSAQASHYGRSPA